MKKLLSVILLICLVGCDASQFDRMGIDADSSSQLNTDYKKTFHDLNLRKIKVTCINRMSEVSELQPYKPRLEIEFEFSPQRPQTITMPVDNCTGGPLFYIQQNCLRYCSDSSFAVYSNISYSYSLIRPIVEYTLAQRTATKF